MMNTEKSEVKPKRTGHTKPKVPTIPLTMPGRYSVGNVMAITGWSHATLYKRMKANVFPLPLKDGNKNFWTTDTVRSALGL